MIQNEWKAFKEGNWQRHIDVRDFIHQNFSPYAGDHSFLAGPTITTSRLWSRVCKLITRERASGGVLDIDTETVTDINAFKPGYIDKELELVVGLQTDAPLKRAVNPFGGIRMARQAAESYGYKLSPAMDEVFTKYRTTHNDGVFAAYTEEMRLARKCGVITGLPDAYGRGRIIGDYRRVALYGVNRLIEDKKEFYSKIKGSTEESIRQREETTMQIKALGELKAMAASYGFDISRPAANAREAIQWLYFGYLAAVRQQNGAAMSLGRVSTFLDIYVERDMAQGSLTEAEAQELMDQFVIKLRMVRQLRTQDYNELFAGDPVWITEGIGGMADDGRALVTKNSFRILHTLINLGPSPEPNLTVLWSEQLPDAFKKYCAKITAETSSIQYENDDLMRPLMDDDYSISCCVSAMQTGKEMQFFGARCNLAKLLLLALNGGVDERYGLRVFEGLKPYQGDILDYDRVMQHFSAAQRKLTKLYVETLNVIHYMHDKYAYESLQMSLHDGIVKRNMAFGIAGLSVIADSLSAIRYGKVKVVRNENGIITDFITKGSFPKYGNNDDRVDSIAVDIVKDFMTDLKKTKTYRKATHTLSVLTITSNVVYGKKTGATPDGRKAGEPFAPGANPMHGRDTEGPLAMLASAAKLPYSHCRDGISITMSLLPHSLGKDPEPRLSNLVAILDSYMGMGGHHLNINMLEREVLQQAMEHPEKYPHLTVRVSGYAVHFVRLSREQQLEVLARTFHDALKAV